MKKEVPRYWTWLLLLAAVGVCVYGAVSGQAEVVLGNEERMALMQAVTKKDRFFDPDEDVLESE